MTPSLHQILRLIFFSWPLSIEWNFILFKLIYSANICRTLSPALGMQWRMKEAWFLLHAKHSGYNEHWTHNCKVPWESSAGDSNPAGGGGREGLTTSSLNYCASLLVSPWFSSLQAVHMELLGLIFLKGMLNLLDCLKTFNSSLLAHKYNKQNSNNGVARVNCPLSNKGPERFKGLAEATEVMETGLNSL